jgi:biuret amidohydrolase
MQQAFGMTVPETVREMCRPTTSAVLVYDAQVGILAHVQDRDRLVERIGTVLQAARA